MTETVTPVWRIKRAWQNLAPKLVAFLATGVSASLVLQVASSFGFTIEPGLASVIAVVVGTIAGYIKSDSVLLDAGALEPGGVAVITGLAPDPDGITTLR